MASTFACQGIQVIKLVTGRTFNNAAEETVWLLIVDGWELEKLSQSWSLNLAGELHLHRGWGEPEDIAPAVCNIVQARGTRR
jgi:hypothetical protein